MRRSAGDMVGASAVLAADGAADWVAVCALSVGIRIFLMAKYFLDKIASYTKVVFFD